MTGVQTCALPIYNAEQQGTGQGQRHAQDQKQGGVSHRLTKDWAVQQVPEVGKAHKPRLRHPLGEGVVEAGQKGDHIKRAHPCQAGEYEQKARPIGFGSHCSNHPFPRLPDRYV